jgi:hypothetical protein
MAKALLEGKLNAEDEAAAIVELMQTMDDYSESTFTGKKAQQGLNEMVAEGIPYFGYMGDALIANAQAADDMAASMDGAAKITWGASDAFEELTKQQIFNVASAGLDKDAQLALAREMGLLDETAYAQLTTLDSLRKMYDDGTISLGTYNTMIANLDASIAALESKSIDINVHWNYSQSGTAGIGGTFDYIPQIEQEFAAGGLARAGKPAIVGERGWEMIIPNTNSLVISHADIMGALAQATLAPSFSSISAPSSYSHTVNNNFNLSLATNQSPQVVQNSFALMRVLVG